MTSTIEWARARFTDRPSIERKFGDHVGWLLRQADPAITAESRADGAWFANDLESWIAYLVFARLYRAGAWA